MGRVLFVSEHDLTRAENLKAVFDAYDGEKEFMRGIYNMQNAPQMGFSVVVCDSLPVYMPNKGDCKSVVIGHGITGDKLYALDESRPGIDARAFEQIDVATCASMKTVDIVARQFGIPLERVEAVGMPRTDAYIGKRKGDGHTIMAGYRRAYFYAPTFRGKYDGERLPNIDWRLLDEILEDDEVIVVKRHYFQRDKIVCVQLDHVKEVEPYEASAPYLMDCDVIVTDYSSILFDAYLLGKPSVLTVDDMDSYLRTRGMYFDYPNQYSSRYMTVEGREREMLETVREAAENGMMETEQECLSTVADMCDGHSCERVCDLVRRFARCT